jgi:hypothetical protein
MIKTLKKVGMEGIHPNIIEATYDTAIANIILKREKLKPFPLKSRMRQDLLFLHSYSISCLNF